MSPTDSDNLRQELKSLKTKKGIFSRAVGQAKQSNQPIESLVKQVQELSQQIKRTESALKELQTIPETKVGQILKNLPPQFKPTASQNIPSNLRVVDSLSTAQWDEFVDQNPNATIYHHSSIRRVIEETFPHSSHYLAAIDLQGQVLGLLPLVEMRSRMFGHFLISLPYFNYGGILTACHKARLLLMKTAAERAATVGARHIEYRNSTEYYNQLPTRSDKVAMLLDLPASSDQLWLNIGTKIRAQIKKAEKAGATIRTGREELIDDFYQVFSRNMRDLGTPVYSKSLFSNMIRYCPGARILTVYLNNKPVSSGMVIGWRNTIEIPWASTIREANRHDANMKLYWEALHYGIEQGYKVFDFGRSTKDTNTYRFKKQWGAIPIELYWQYWL